MITNENETGLCDDVAGRFMVLGDDLPESAVDIARAGMEMFARQGFSATSVRDITKKSGTSIPMLYYYFGSKRGLLNTILQRIAAAFYSHFSWLEKQPISFEEKLQLHAEILFGHRSDVEDVVHLLFRLVLDDERAFGFASYNHNLLSAVFPLANVFKDAIETHIIIGSLATGDHIAHADRYSSELIHTMLRLRLMKQQVDAIELGKKGGKPKHTASCKVAPDPWPTLMSESDALLYLKQRIKIKESPDFAKQFVARFLDGIKTENNEEN